MRGENMSKEKEVRPIDANALRKKTKIWIAYNHTRIGVMSFLAHEIWHYYQNVHHGIKNMDFEKCEKDADEAADELLTLWLIRGGYVNGQP